MGALASVGDFVWVDADGNGIQNSGEAGISGVTVQLLDSVGSVLQTQLTNSLGAYLFDNLAPNSYWVQFTLPPSITGGAWAFTTTRTGSDTSVDSDADQSTGRSLQFSLVAGQALRTIDAGVVTQTSTTTTSVVGGSTTTAPQSTSTIPQSTSTVPVSSTTVPVSTTIGTAPSTTIVRPTTTFVGSVLGNCKISSTVWRDTNGNGLIDNNEVPYAGVTVQATQGSLRFIAVTNQLGEYTIANIPCGDWSVIIIDGLPAGVPTPPAKTVRVLGEQLTNNVAPFGIAVQTDPALTGSNTLRSLSFALSILGIGGLMATARRRRITR